MCLNEQIKEKIEEQIEAIIHNAMNDFSYDILVPGTLSHAYRYGCLQGLKQALRIISQTKQEL